MAESHAERYERDGYLVVDNALTSAQIALLRHDFEAWVDESREHDAPYGVTADARARFDLESEHSAAKPALRRVASPVEVSEVYLEVMRANAVVDVVADLIGPNVCFNNSKINSKQPGAATEVKFHQDFMFQPHTNDGLVAVLIFLDDVTEDNGPLEVVPGTHRGELFSHWHDGVYTGTVAPEVVDGHIADAVSVTGPAGTACFMHTRLLHGSKPNSSDRPRTLFIAEYRAEDSKPLQVNHLPSKYEDELVRGERTSMVRCTPYEMLFPEVPKGASFFDQQAKAAGA